MGLPAYFRRWRHGMGFGIHSPFAFRFVTEVLNQPHAYYAYDNIPSCDALTDDEWRLLVRLLVHFRPRVVGLGDGLDPKVGRFIRRVVPSVKFGAQPELVVASGSIPEHWRERIESGELHAIIFNFKSIPSAGVRTRGMAFSNGHTLVMAGYPHLPSQNFEVRF